MSPRTWGLLLLAVVARCASVSFLNGDPYYRLVPRSLTGGGFLVQPGWLDLAVPAVFVLALWTSRPQGRPTASALGDAARDALWILAFPLLAGLSLFLFVQRWLLTPMFNLATALRWIQFVLAFAAMNMFMDRVSVRNRWARLGLALILAGALALTQDLVVDPRIASFRFAMFLSTPGILLGATAWALRPVYRRSPLRAVVTAALVGGVACFLVVAARSEQVFTALLPALALLAGAAAIRSTRPWPRRIALGGVVSLGLSCSLLLPRLVSPELRERMAENSMAPAHTETVGRLTVSYDDPSVREVAVRLARVLEAANGVSQEFFGVSPEVTHLTIGGIGPGGFHAEFPDRIEGNLPSERAVQLLRDGTFLNAPEFSARDLDPVNAILHEYSHLYGAVPYLPWVMGPEEEGWATYAATRLSLRLYEKQGAGLWDPPYDYARRARAITRSNLDGHAVMWSHPDEFGGFRLWHSLGKRDGEKALFRRRWESTRRDLQRFLLMISNPKSAWQVARSFGEADFVSFGKAAPVLFTQAVSREDSVRSAGALGIPPEQTRTQYDRRAHDVLQPGVILPESRGVLDGVIALVVLGVGVATLRHAQQGPAV